MKKIKKIICWNLYVVCTYPDNRFDTLRFARFLQPGADCVNGISDKNRFSKAQFVVTVAESMDIYGYCCTSTNQEQRFQRAQMAERRTE
jgi:hypothetical protein